MKKISILLFFMFLGFVSACNKPSQQPKESSEEEVSKTPNSLAESPLKEEGEKKEEKEEKEEGEEGVKNITGTFVGIEQGDYFYFQVEISQGEARSFMVLQPDKTYEEVAENVEQYIGKQVKVYWKTSKENIPEAGGEIEVDKYIKAKFL